MAESLTMMPWFPRDFLSATRGWSVTAKGVYRELLDAQWEMGTLPKQAENLRKTIGASLREWNQGWKLCECKFPIVGEGRQNERLEQHRAKSQRLSEKRREIGRRGGQANAQAIGAPIGQAIGQANAEAIAQAKVNHPSPSPSKEKIKSPAARAPSIANPEDQDPDEYLIWTAGIELLGESKRSLMGKLVQQHGRDLVARKLGELMAMPDKPRDPAAYFVGCMRKLERRFQP